jgi:DNA processing protein
VAVLGCGIDRDYPAAHAELAARIRATGLTVSEYAPSVEPAPWRFPARNRIIAGLAAATVVVEARERSGALITADLALEEGREVFAVPGEITSALSSGTNDLLKLGASPLTSSTDVLDLFGLTGAEARSVELGASAEAVLARLRDGPASADELARATGLDAGALAAALTELELAGGAVAGGAVYRAN